MSPLSCLAAPEFRMADRLVLMDLELTCWQDNNLRTSWADSRRPPEVLEIGLAAYDLQSGSTVSTFSSLVRPTLNPLLSDYCRNLVKVEQAEVAAASPLPEVAPRVTEWLDTLGRQDTVTCSWCTLDRVWLHDDAMRAGCADPFEGRRHVNLSALLLQALGDEPGPTPPRDAMTERLGLPRMANRHRALSDAADLARFFPPVMTAA